MGESDIRMEATAKAIRCRSAMWGGQPCNPKGGCPFGRKPPQKPSELRSRCKDVTPEMWEDAMQSKCFAQSLKSLCFFLGGTHVAGWVEEAERAAKEGKVVKYE